MAGEICVDRGCDMKPGEPCQECADEAASIPMVLRPSVPEDFREPPKLPPFVHCAGGGMDPELPENAGRHAAPVPFDETSDTQSYLRDLRGASGPRRHF
ncbi:hypothetical protein K8R04_03555 [Candidatus Uhrbacteria bacterium]|nr:hypothetical protein [Candidatus Uhrbacteria bacterium]